MSGIPPELLHLYYKRLFPSRELVNWLSTNGTFAHREIAFVLNLDGEDIFCRHKSFADTRELHAALLKETPVRIEIGAEYSSPPKDKEQTMIYECVGKEFTIDVDLTDYNNDSIHVRRCCVDQRKMCDRCWPLIQSAVRVLDVTLKEDFGVKQAMWVFSGRRGVHCWIMDKRFRSMNNAQRQCIVSYLSLNPAQDLSHDENISFHPTLERAYGLLLPFFEKCLVKEQGFLSTEKDKKYVQNRIPFRYQRDVMWANDKWSPMQKWMALKKNVIFVQSSMKIDTKSREVADFRALCKCLHRIVLETLYPHLDVKVSVQVIHLLKSPFCVHPATGKVCLPMDPERMQAITHPSTEIPTLFDLEKDMNAKYKNPDEKTAFLDEFHHSIDYLKRFIAKAKTIDVGDVCVGDVEDLIPAKRHKVSGSKTASSGSSDEDGPSREIPASDLNGSKIETSGA